jgi:DNA modification methylase
MEVKIPEAELVQVSKLKKDGKNPNRMSKEQKIGLGKTMEKYGFLVPIITNRDYLIADGEQRLDVAVEILHMEMVPVIRIPLKEVDRRIIRQVMNKLKGVHEKDLDQLEYERILEDGGAEELKDLLALTDKQMANILDSLENKVPEKDIPALPDKATTKIGEIYQLGRHKIMCGDCTKPADMKKLMGKTKTDMTFTDPPYNLGFFGTIDGQFEPLKNDTIPEDKYEEFLVLFLQRILDHSKPEASHYICMDFRNYPLLFYKLGEKKLDVINCVVWDKVFAGMGYKYRYRHEFIVFAGDKEKVLWYGTAEDEDVVKITRVQEKGSYVLDMRGFSLPTKGNAFVRIKREATKPARVPSLEEPELTFRIQDNRNTDLWEGFSMNFFNQRKEEESGGIIHPTMKPLILIEIAIQNSTYPSPESIIQDPCAGSGSTLIAAERTGRTCYAMEIDARYCDVIIKRWENLTGERAVLCK